MTEITFAVSGTPVTQGSTKAFVVGGRARVAHDKSKALMDWRGDIAHAAQEAAHGRFAAVGVPVSLSATFYLQRPASAPKKVLFPTKKPDLDKLVRSLLDAGTGVLWADDSQVVAIQASKAFAPRAPGVQVEVCWND